MIVLDTNIVSELMKAAPDSAVRDWLARVDDTSLTTTAVTVAEIEFGLNRLPVGRRRGDLQARFEALVTTIGVLPLDETAAMNAGRLRAMREAAGLPSSPSDMMIAGIAAAVGASLATRNVRDFSGLGIDVRDPWSDR
jgi:predicted nucleic acid-binding protein